MVHKYPSLTECMSRWVACENGSYRLLFLLFVCVWTYQPVTLALDDSII